MKTEFLSTVSRLTVVVVGCQPKGCDPGSVCGLGRLFDCCVYCFYMVLQCEILYSFPKRVSLLAEVPPLVELLYPCILVPIQLASCCAPSPPITLLRRAKDIVDIGPPSLRTCKVGNGWD